MTFTAKNQLAVAFKKLVGKAHTSPLFGFSSEVYPSNVQIDNTTIFAETLPTSPTSTEYAITNNIVEKVHFELVAIDSSQYTPSTAADTGDGIGAGPSFFNGKHAYLLKLPAAYETNSSNSKKGTGSFTNGSVLANSKGALQIVPTSYGSVYRPLVFTNNGEIFPSDSDDFYLDTYSGVLFLQDLKSTGPAANDTPIRVEGYLYIGKYQKDVVTNPAGSTGYLQYNNNGVFDASSNLFWDIANNRLGIGTSPGTKLEVNGAIRGGLFSIAQTNTGEAWFGRGGDRTLGTYTLQLGGASATDTKFEIVDRAWSKVMFSVSGEAPVDSFQINSAGNVGIGTPNPQAQLEVAGGSYNIRMGPKSWYGGTAYPTVYGSHPDGFVMLGVPHVPYLQNGVNDYTGGTIGAVVRFAGNTSASGYWDAGIASNIGADKFVIRRNASTTPFLAIDNAGNVDLVGDLNTTAAISYTQGIGARVLQPEGGLFATNISELTGYIKITLPVSWTNTMMMFDVDIYDYAGDTDGESFKIQVGGYNYAPEPTWANVFANILTGRTDKFFNVRFGHDGSKCAIYIGESTSTWSYPQISVSNFVAGYSEATAANWADGWSIQITSTLGTITRTKTLENVASEVLRTIADNDLQPLVSATIGTNDYFRIAAGGGNNGGYAEIATADDGTEPIYVRQYTGVFSTLTRTATLLDGSGNTSFPGTVTAPSFSGNLNWQGVASPAGANPAAGLYVQGVYNNGYPTTYGNVLTMGGGGYGQLLLGWSGTSGAHANNYIRSLRDSAVPTGQWSPWALILTDVNYNSYSPTLTGTGASGTWGINITGNANTLDNIDSSQFLRSDTSDTFSGGILVVENSAGALIETSVNANGLQSYQPTAQADAFITFHVGGDYAFNFGLDGTTNDLAVGGWSMGSVAHKVWHAGNDGAGSGLDADTLDGLQPTSANTGNTIMSRDGNGDTTLRYGYGNYFNSTDDVSNGTISHIMAKFGDNFYRSATAAKVVSFINGLTLSPGGVNSSNAVYAPSFSTNINKPANTGGVVIYQPGKISFSDIDDGAPSGQATSIWNMYSNTASNFIFEHTGNLTNIKAYISWSGVNSKLLNFTGQHRNISDTIDLKQKEKNIGLIVVSDGSYASIDSNAITINEALPKVQLSSQKNQKSVFGVISDSEDENSDSREYALGNFVSVSEKTAEDTRLIINSLGEGAIWVCNVNGNLENGDYITTCEVPGYGMKQDSEFLANYTVAKITCDCDFDLQSPIYICEEFEWEGQTYRKAFVGCTYHCG